jgi:heat shock protein HtpX
MYSTIMLLSVLTAILGLFGWLFGGFPGVAIALALAFALNSFIYWKSDSLVLRMYGAKPAEEPRLDGMLKGLAREAGIPVPRLYMIEGTSIPNAFATGRSPSSSAIAVTRPLLEFRDDEIGAVLAHEVAHIRSRDTLVNVIAATIGGAIGFLAQMAYFGLYLDGDSRSGSNLISLLLLAIFAPIAAFMVRMAISRKSEFRADYLGTLFTKSPRSLVRALEKIEDAASSRPMRGPAATSHLWIVNPFSRNWFTGLFSTHPPVRERMKRLLEMEGRVLE